MHTIHTLTYTTGYNFVVWIRNYAQPSKKHQSNPTPDKAQTFPKEPWCVTLFPQQSLFNLSKSVIIFPIDIRLWYSTTRQSPLSRLSCRRFFPPPPRGVLMSSEFKLQRLFSRPAARHERRSFASAANYRARGNEQPRSPYSPDWHSLPLICQQIRMDGVGAILSRRCRARRRGCRAASPARYHWQVVWLGDLRTLRLCHLTIICSWFGTYSMHSLTVIAYSGRLGLLLAFVCGQHATYITISGVS